MVRKNALQILIPKYGLESAIVLERKSHLFKYEEEEGTITALKENVLFKVFDRVTVKVKKEGYGRKKAGNVLLVVLVRG